MHEIPDLQSLERAQVTTPKNQLPLWGVVSALLLFAALHIASRYSYLLFHSLAEGFSIVVASGVFMLAWNSRKTMEDGYLLFLGIVYLFVGQLDLLHTLSFHGMAVIPHATTNSATQLWIAARYLESLAILAAPNFLRRKLWVTPTLASCALVSAIVVWSIFAGMFPVSFAEGEGLTPFKIISEYVICGILAIGALILHLNRRQLDSGVYRLVIVSIGATIASELSFTLYGDPYGLFNQIGHFLKIVSFYLIYRAVIVIGLRRPYDLFYRRLKESRNALFESERRYRLLFEHMPVGFALHEIVTDADGKPVDYRFIQVNDSFEKQTGLSAENVLGRCVREVMPGIENAEPNLISCYGGVALGGESQHLEIYSEHLDRNYDVVVYSPERHRFVTLLSDITKRKKAEEELQRRAEMLSEANRDLESFSYSVAHDLRAPLRTIMGFVDCLLEDYANDLNKGAKQYLDRIVNGARTMNILISDLLNLSRIGRQELIIDIVDLSAMAQEIITQMRDSEPHRKVEFSIHPHIKVQGDPRLLNVALTNLLNNAWKYSSKQQKSRIEFGVTRVSGQNAYFVRDNGSGFDSSRAEKLFSPFQRFHAQSEFPGTGIGLSIVHRIIKRHGGSIWAESKVGEGAVFYFSLGAESLDRRKIP